MDASASAARARALEEPTETTGIFGTVTNKRVFFWHSGNWLRASCWEELDLLQITAVRLEVHRHKFGGFLLAVCGIASIAAIHPMIIGQGAGVVLIALAALLVWGLPVVHIGAAGQDYSAKSWPWRQNEASLFVATISQQLMAQ
jgi:hypothetical protein